jgi:hypothetical protein
MALYRKWTNAQGMPASWAEVDAIAPLAILSMAGLTISSATSRQGKTRRSK